MEVKVINYANTGLYSQLKMEGGREGGREGWREGGREGGSVCLWRACARALLCVYENIMRVWTCVRACVRACVHACVRARCIYLLFRNSHRLRVFTRFRYLDLNIY